MAKLVASQIRQYASKAGFTGNDLDIAVAVAIAESGGDTNAHSSKSQTRDNSYGLWQINMLGSMGPDRRKRFGLTNNDQLYDPAINARVAYGIWKEQGWAKGWTTYGTEKYDDILKVVKSGKVDLGGGVVVGKSPLDETIDAADKVPNAINSFGTTLFKSVANIGGIIVAISFLSVGVILLVMSSNSAKKAVSIAANVVPGGAAAKTAVKKALKP